MLIIFSIFLGIGIGMNTQANGLALYTYFKEKRRLATGLSGAIAGIGGIIMPHIIAMILPLYGVQGTVLFCSALGLCAVGCALVYQPVQYHIKRNEDKSVLERMKCDDFAEMKEHNQHKFSLKHRHKENNSSPSMYDQQLNKNQFETDGSVVQNGCADKHDDDDEEIQNSTLWHKIMIFFDLDLLKDLTYVNLMLGVALGTFVEHNFSQLTPFILDDWQLDKQQIATAMSLLAGMDVIMRLLIPFIADKIDLGDDTFFLIGILSMSIGRIGKF